MGVDYKANYGLGIELRSSEIVKNLRLPEDPEDLEVYEIMEGLSLPSNLRLIQSGDGGYTGDVNDYYIILKEPLSNGITGLKEKSDALIDYVRSLGFTTPDEVQLVGGLYVF